ncbi:MAG: isocitrate/isopropylmalate dehydrogenase family protein [Planctomycetota bacterium]|nr:isocitrate/isopropylmalate dehydrogenase family protein [Planctomycetota bacterium]
MAKKSPRKHSSHSVVLIPGDGIGPEVIGAAREVIDAAGVKIDWVPGAAGESALKPHGSLLPKETLDAIVKYKVALKGPCTTPIGGGHKSINVSLRQGLNLYAAVRPVRSIEGIKTRYDNVEMVIVRENTEGLYSGIEHEVVPGVVEALKIVTERACTRISEYAFEYARGHARKRVTVFHKANIMKMADGLFLKCARAVSQKYPDIAFNEMIIDNGCMQIIKDPSRFDVLLLDNLYGDIISDLCAGLVGGLGVVPGANIGEAGAVFESVHGSAPDIAGKGIANPLAAIMSGVMMLNFLGESEAAQRIKAAYNDVLASDNPKVRTKDLGGEGGTREFTRAVIKRVQKG